MNLYQRAALVVSNALEASAESRDALIDLACGTDDELRREVRSLLDAHSRAGDFLETPPDTSDFTSASQLAAGTMVGGYRIIGVLGEGGMGIVYLAKDTRLGRRVALKAITPRFTHDAQWRERLRREARAAAALTHPCVATVYALEEIDDQLYLATEHVAGETLREWLTRGPLPIEVVRQIGVQLASALADAHALGIVHRDLKPENVMLTPGGAIKILDFGLAKHDVSGADDAVRAAGDPLTVVGAVFGTPAYMSPEQLRGESATAASDIFAVGLILAELAGGHHPFAGQRTDLTTARLLSAAPDLSDVPAALQPIIRACLSKDAATRPESANVLRAALEGGERVPIDSARAFWWWQFDHAAVSLFSVALAIALWMVRRDIPAPLAPAVLWPAFISAFASTTMRLHLWFSARVYPDGASAHHRRSSRWIRAADTILAIDVTIAGIALPPTAAAAQALLVASSAILVVASHVIGPATARAAKVR